MSLTPHEHGPAGAFRRPGELTRRTIGGLLWAGWGKSAQAVLHLLVLSVLARLLSPSDFGVVSAALVVIGFSAIFTQLGMGPALVQRPVLDQRHLDTAFSFSLGMAVSVGGVIAASASLVAAFFQAPQVDPVVRTLALIFPMQGLALVAESLARRELRFRWLAKIDVVAYGIAYGAVGVGLATVGWGVWALVWAELARVGIRTAVLIVGQEPRPRIAWERAAFGELMYFGGGFTIARVANYLAVQGDNLVVGRMLGPAALGLYGRAYQLMAAPATGFGAVLDSVLFPAMARVQDDPQRLGTAYRRGVTLLATMVLPVSVVALVLAPEIIHVALGAHWSGAVLPFQILALGMFFRTSYKMSDSICRATAMVYERAVRQIIYAALVIGGALVGQRWGIVGVAASVVLALVINFLLMAQLSLRVTSLSWADLGRAHVPGLLLSAVCFPCLWCVSAAMRSWGAAPLIVVVGGTGAACIGALAAMALAPRTFVGGDGLWMLSTLRTYLPHRFVPAHSTASESQ